MRKSALSNQNVSHGSIDLLTHRPRINAERRQTLGEMPIRNRTHVMQETDTECLKNYLVHPHIGDPAMSSPQILGGLEFKSASSRKRSYQQRNSIDSLDVSRYRASKRLALESLKEDKEECQADRIHVYVRVRPLSSKERDSGARCCVKAANEREIYLTEMVQETDYLRLKRLKGRYFVFDGAFPEDTGQEEIYLASTAKLVEGVLEGRNCSVFCYGATGAGKTFTMLGTVKEPGVMVLALKDLFTKLMERSREGGYSVHLSYLEVYNETVKDLLSPGRPLILREDAKQGIVAAGLTQYKASSADEVMSLLQRGNQNRTTEPTRLNETSSRSHAVLQVTVEYRIIMDSAFVVHNGKLSLIDLAGSERAIATDQYSIRSVEGANINRSLLALSSCISALVEGKKHIPFRNSKLTQLLKDSLGGRCQTAMIANISPSHVSFGETQNTLYWADRAKAISTKSYVVSEAGHCVPESGSEQLQLLLQVQKENQLLRTKVAELKQKLLVIENTVVNSSAAVETPAKMLQSKGSIVLGKGLQKMNKKELMRTPSSRSTRKMVLMRTPVRAPEEPTTDPVSSDCTSRDNAFRKRCFRDVTNTNSVTMQKSSRSNTPARTPSQLLQPGFLCGRPSYQ